MGRWLVCMRDRVSQRQAKWTDRGVPEADFHEIEDVDAATYEKDFHNKVVEGDPCME